MKRVRRPWVLLACTILLLVAYLVNVAGWSVFFYINVGPKDWVVAASGGLFHTAIADHFDYANLKAELGPLVGMLDDVPTYAIDLPPFLFYSEYLGSGIPINFWFQLITNPDYFGLEFPWPVLLLTVALITWWRWRIADHQRNALSPGAEVETEIDSRDD
ncbi:MAG: hypothetical protein AAFY08_02875 [Planctomycetota bacterium]